MLQFLEKLGFNKGAHNGPKDCMVYRLATEGGWHELLTIDRTAQMKYVMRFVPCGSHIVIKVIQRTPWQ